MGYLALAGWLFLLLAFIIIFGYPFKNWVERTGRTYLTPVVYVIVACGLTIDVFLNWMLSPLFLEPPRALFETITMRMQRYKKEETGFKLVFANYLCAMVSIFDKDHC